MTRQQYCNCCNCGPLVPFCACVADTIKAKFVLVAKFILVVLTTVNRQRSQHDTMVQDLAHITDRSANLTIFD